MTPPDGPELPVSPEPTEEPTQPERPGAQLPGDSEEPTSDLDALRHLHLPADLEKELSREIVKVKAGIKRRWLRVVGWLSGSTALTLAAALLALYLWASSDAFEDTVRHRVIAQLEEATGGRVEIAGFHWQLLHLRVEATGIVIHGLEAATEAPYARIASLKAEAGILGLFTMGVSPRLVLHSVEIDQPQYHLMVYPDGSTNQPHPRRQRKSGKPALDTLFDLRVGQLTVRQGVAIIADREIGLEFSARDTRLDLGWFPTISATGPHSPRDAAFEDNGSYRIQLELNQLSFARGLLLGKVDPMLGKLELTAQLARNRLDVESLRLTSFGSTLTAAGLLTDFAHPSWKGSIDGQVDVRVLAPTTSMPFLRKGVLNLKGVGWGQGSEFHGEGDVSAGEAIFRDEVVDAHVRSLTAHFRISQDKMLISNVDARLMQGGQVQGEFFYDHWLVYTPEPGSAEDLHYKRAHLTPPTSTGRVRGTVNGVTLDTVLDMLAGPRYQRLGMDAVIAGHADADWTGLGRDLIVGGSVALSPSDKPVPGEAPVNGQVEAGYHVASGSVEVGRLDVRMPHSMVEANGSLGVIPIDRPSSIELQFHSSDLSEFDAVLNALDLAQGNRSGAAALPVLFTGPVTDGRGLAESASQAQSFRASRGGAAGLTGQASFQGTYTNSWLKPRIEGRLTATDLGIEIPPEHSGGPPRFVGWDSVEVDGLYTPASIAVRRGVLRRGGSSLTLEGRLDSSDPSYDLSRPEPEFSTRSVLLLHTDAERFPIEDFLALAGIDAPVSGRINAKVDLQGPVNALVGTGNLELDKAAAYGETFDRVRVTGSLARQQFKLASLTAERGQGRVTASGSYDMNTRLFQLDARGSAIEVGDLEHTRESGLALTGKLGFTLLGGGTFTDPRLTAHATLSGMRIASEPVSDLLMLASTQNRTVTYDLSSKQTAGEFSAHGDTELAGNFATRASLKFAKFDIGALLKLLHVTGISGQSDLEGTADISGPLAQPKEMSGEASVKELAVIVEGVHLKSQGAVHASLSAGMARLDPVEITGEDTDLKLRGTLNMTGKQQLDLQANGSVNLRLAESLDPDLIASGVTTFQMEAHGPLLNPVLQGKAEFKDGALALGDFPNGLSQIQGTLEFIQNRLVVRSLTAMSGGGQLSVTGYLGFQRGLYADLTATGKGIRLRYPQGVSSLADATLHLQGPQNNLLLSGSVVVTRFAINADLDLAALATQKAATPAIVSPDAPSNHFRLDVHLTSAPQLNFQNAYAKLAGDVDLHLRGTLASPSLLGRISLTEGNTSIGGTRYELQRGDITFNNPVRIQPNIDLDATARVEDYDITLGLHGTTDKLNVTYRSEPPLPEADVIALLAQGRTQSEQQANVQQQQNAGDNPTTELLLGGALNATVSNRVQRLFGTGAVKVDPNFIGTLGNSSARVTVVEQIGSNLTFTFASNVNTTAQQLVQAEIAVNRHVSLLVTQDESGIFSMVIKIRRRYR
jgi:translocation and assembly module TamB